MIEEEMAGTPNSFIVTRKETLMDKRLSSTEKLVYARICSFGTYFEASEKCAELLGMSARQISRAKKRLEECGYIKCLANTGRGKVYKAIYDLSEAQVLAEIGSRLDNMSNQESRLDNVSGQTGHVVPTDPTSCTTYNKIKINIKERESVSQLPKAVPTLPPEAYELAEDLHNRILDNKPTRKIDRDWRENWSKAIDRIHRLDKREWEDIGKVIEWCQADGFWWKNILSGQTLREKFDRLEDEMNNTKKSKVEFLKLS